MNAPYITRGAIITDAQGNFFASTEDADTAEAAFSHAEQIVAACNENEKRTAQLIRFEKALRHIAYEPLGPLTASHREALDIATQIARDALAL